MSTLLWWIVLAGLIGSIARKTDKSFLLWFIISLILTPIGGAVLLFFNRRKKCSQCKELIKRDANKCKFCHSSTL
jgi:hypothetical protein